MPKTAGSKKAFIPKGWTRAIITDAAGKAGKDWRADVKAFALDAMKDLPMFTEPVALTLHFIMPRPKAHFRGKAAVLREDAPHYHASKPDVLKMARAVEDALTGIVWRDDAQIAVEHLTKRYGEQLGCTVSVMHVYAYAQPVGP